MTPRASSKTFGPQVTLHDVGSGASPAPASSGSNGPRSLSSMVRGPMTDAQREKLDRASARIRDGSSNAMPMLCKGLQCPVYDFCELQKTGLPVPIGERCPIEEFAIAAWKEDFLKGLDLNGSDPNTYLIRNMIDDVAILLAQQMRILGQSALNPQVMSEEVVGFSSDGTPLTARRLDPSLDLLLRTGDKKLRMLRDMLATPRAKAEAGRLGFDDPASKAANAQAQAAKLKALSGRQYKKLDIPTITMLPEVKDVEVVRTDSEQ